MRVTPSFFRMHRAIKPSQGQQGTKGCLGFGVVFKMHSGDANHKTSTERETMISRISSISRSFNGWQLLWQRGKIEKEPLLWPNPPHCCCASLSVSKMEGRTLRKTPRRFKEGDNVRASWQSRGKVSAEVFSTDCEKLWPKILNCEFHLNYDVLFW